MKKVSVIIPVYNSELFVRQCIQSVLAQTYHNQEILLIDDGSVDQSRSICEEMCTADERIKLFGREHKGVSSARNYGLDKAVGTYIFFLDSDDAIHPRLIEKLVQKIEDCQADLAFCTCSRKKSSQMDAVLNDSSEDVSAERWKVGDERDSEEWYHRIHARELTCIGGKLIRRSALGALRFDERMGTGEDTVFMYFLASSRIKMVYYQMEWYYYRMHPKSLTHCENTCEGYFKKYDIIRSRECQRKHIDTAFHWEKRLFGEMQEKYLLMKHAGNEEGIQIIRSKAREEMKHPLFQMFSLKTQIFYYIFFFCHWVYSFLNRLLRLVRQGKREKDEYADVGILTFHCADDYGAMLQAYALKNYLRGSGIHTDIIRYEPFFMTGRYWWIPYVPGKGVADLLKYGWRGWKEHLSMGKNFFILKDHMKDFRRNCLLDVSHPKLILDSQLRRLPYRYIIVGSDQIWNPDITYGLRKAYFGAFKCKGKEKVIAYAASLGGDKLSTDFTREFSELLKSLDAVSVREEEAVPYVRNCCKAAVTAVCDPVFLLEKSEWTKVEKKPSRTGYIFVYTTQTNIELANYVRKLSKEKKMPVVELRTSTSGPAEDFLVDYETGPAEFLGYIHRADYVVTNSFHTAAFSIIYQKKFFVFLHRSRGGRLRNILLLYGLEDRLYQEGREPDIDSEINWGDVILRIKGSVKASNCFLQENLSER